MNTNNNNATIIFAYSAMIFIWSTTPLAIKWSSYGIDFITGLSARMLIGSAAAAGLCLFLNNSLPLNKKSMQVYFASGFSIYAAMMLVYYGAQFVSSGLVSVIFGMNPILTSWFAIQLFASEKFSAGKLIGAIFGIAGLAYIFREQMYLGQQAVVGIMTILLSVSVHSISAVWIKHINAGLSALSITTGGLVFSLPLFLLTFWMFAQPLPGDIPARTLWSIIYLGLMGSVIGFVSYYYVLTKLNASTVALATLITPVIALLLGNRFNQEPLTTQLLLGTALILSGLIMHQFRGIISIQRVKPKSIS